MRRVHWSIWLVCLSVLGIFAYDLFAQGFCIGPDCEQAHPIQAVQQLPAWLAGKITPEDGVVYLDSPPKASPKASEELAEVPIVPKNPAPTGSAVPPPPTQAQTAGSLGDVQIHQLDGRVRIFFSERANIVYIQTSAGRSLEIARLAAK